MLAVHRSKMVLGLCQELLTLDASLRFVNPVALQQAQGPAEYVHDMKFFKWQYSTHR